MIYRDSPTQQTIRVHSSIGTDEMGAMDEPTAVERFVRAAKERNIRVCYVRLFTSGLAHDPDVLAANTAFVQKIVKGMHEARLTVGEGPAHPYLDDPKPGLAERGLMALGVLGGTLLLLRVFTGIAGKALVIASVIGLALALGAAVPSATPKGREVLALLSACVFPTLGLCAITLPRPLANTTNGEVLRRAFTAYLQMTLVTVIGIVLVVGLLAGRLFLLKVDEFLGVKLVLVTPVALVAAYYGLGLGALNPNAGWAERWHTVRCSVLALASRPLLAGQVVDRHCRPGRFGPVCRAERQRSRRRRVGNGAEDTRSLGQILIRPASDKRISAGPSGSPAGAGGGGVQTVPAVGPAAAGDWRSGAVVADGYVLPPAHAAFNFRPARADRLGAWRNLRYALIWTAIDRGRSESASQRGSAGSLPRESSFIVRLLRLRQCWGRSRARRPCRGLSRVGLCRTRLRADRACPALSPRRARRTASRAVDRYRPSALLPAIARCDLFLSGGGSLLQDVSSPHSIFYYLGRGQDGPDCWAKKPCLSRRALDR